MDCFIFANGSVQVVKMFKKLWAQVNVVEYMIHKNYVKGRREETVTFTVLGCQP